MVEHFGGGSRLFLHKSACLSSRLQQEVSVCAHPVHQAAEVLLMLYLKATLSGQQSLRLLKTVVVGTENHWHAPYCGLQHIVYAHTETAAHVSHLSIAVDTGEQSVGVASVYKSALRFSLDCI